jgi:hypothetical protein
MGFIGDLARIVDRERNSRIGNIFMVAYGGNDPAKRLGKTSWILGTGQLTIRIDLSYHFGR